MRAALSLILLLAVGTAVWLILGGAGEESPALDSAADSPAARPAAGALGALEPTAREIERAEAAPAAADLATLGAEPEERPVVGWFHGQLRVVAGELPAPPMLTAHRRSSDFGSELEGMQVRVDPRTLEFRAPAHVRSAQCSISLPSVLRAVGASGGSVDGNGEAHFASLDETMVIDVEVKPHAGVLFLHAITDAPLSGAQVWHRVAMEGSSTTYGHTLGEDGLMIFDFERIADVEGAEVISFSVHAPPDVGYSSTQDFPVEEFLSMPRPVVLRFSPTQSLRFRVMDPAGAPIAGASVRIGSGDTDAITDAEGKIRVLQSAPPADTVGASAPGFLDLKQAIDASSAIEQRLTLWPASRLLIEGDTAPPDGWQNLRVEVTFRGKEDVSALPPGRFQHGRITESHGGLGVTSNHEDLYFKLTTGFSREGRVMIDGIHADVPAQVKVTYRGFTVLDERVPFAPGDGEHRLRVPPLPRCFELSGFVTDESGNPIAGAEVSVLSGDSWWQEKTTSDERGEFSLGDAPVGSTVKLRFVAEGYAPRQVEHAVHADDADSLGAVRLGPGHAVIVRVVGPDGAPLDLANAVEGAWRPVLDLWGESVEPSAGAPQTLGPGEFWFKNLPAENLGCSIQQGFSEWRLDATIDTTLPLATVTVSEAMIEWLTGGQ